jgi:Phosphotransferase enzyme family
MEARITSALPEEVPVPRLLWSHDESEAGWVALLFEDVEGRNPAMPWRADELSKTLDAITVLSELLTPSPLAPGVVVGHARDWSVVSGRYWERLAEERPARLDAWSARHLDGLVDLEGEATSAVEGDTLLHLDLRADNLLLTPDRVLVVDWPPASARLGSTWSSSPPAWLCRAGRPPRSSCLTIRTPVVPTPRLSPPSSRRWPGSSLGRACGPHRQGCPPCENSRRRKASWRGTGWRAGQGGARHLLS